MSDEYKKCSESCECMGKGHERPRREDRRSCHNISLVVGLAVLARDTDTAIGGLDLMISLVTPSGHAPN